MGGPQVRDKTMVYVVDDDHGLEQDPTLATAFGAIADFLDVRLPGGTATKAATAWGFNLIHKTLVCLCLHGCCSRHACGRGPYRGGAEVPTDEPGVIGGENHGARRQVQG